MAPTKINNHSLLAKDGEDKELPIVQLQVAVDGEDHQVLPIVQLQVVDGEDHIPDRILRLFLSQRCCSFPE
jgi:hypothetical protein